MTEIAALFLLLWLSVSVGFWTVYQGFSLLRKGRSESWFDYVLNLIIALAVGPIIAFYHLWRRI